ncbi:MAG: DEAD/DEAH box helicase family protein, partial [Crocinitomicaceae bacterium]|nr:DEAD/DEAH box helicase family protein [Crocinitomicaceae bacterium]
DDDDDKTEDAKIGDDDDDKDEERKVVTSIDKMDDAKYFTDLRVESVIIGDSTIKQRLPPVKRKINIKANSYYLNNRKIFTNFINSLFLPYKTKKENKSGKEVKLFTHQEIIRDYINLYSPYRGLLIYHGLGSGKSCGSIGIAEGLKNDKQIYIMTPASLQMNYVKELKKCGDPIYRTNQYWEFVETKGNAELEETLHKVLGISLKYIRKQKGAWMVNVKEKSNYNLLSEVQQKSLDKQINEMIMKKYRFFRYNGMRLDHLAKLEQEAEEEHERSNPFDHKVVIIDEAHNFISRIVNKLKSKKTKSLSVKLYEYIMDAIDCRVVFLTGTPMINYPNEIGILFNMLRGYINTYHFKIDVKTKQKVNVDYIRKALKNNRLVDYIDYKPTTRMLSITRNPFTFETKLDRSREYNGVAMGEKNKVSEKEFIKKLEETLSKNKIKINADAVKVEKNKALPDTFAGFNKLFINPANGNMVNNDLFKRRILGLTSYFRSAKEELLPEFNPEKDIIIDKIPMSNYQLGVYETARDIERKESDNNAKRKKKAENENVFEEGTSTYRIFSRSFCNFVFPIDIERPLPMKRKKKDGNINIKNLDEDLLDNADVNERVNNVDGRFQVDDSEAIEQMVNDDYGERIENAMKMLEDKANLYLTYDALKTYSPKFQKILFNIQKDDHKGCHLIYSQFRTLEGIGILSLILKQNGYSEFKIKKDDSGKWLIDMTQEELSKPSFALYTGTEDEEKKEIIRNIFNSNWGIVPSTLRDQLMAMNKNNFYGEIVKVFMITSSGAEGIDLKNVRYVHIVEPYWHPVRKEQVIGRAVRINSHIQLTPEFRNVKVFMYLMTFSENQLLGDKNGETKEDREPKVSQRLQSRDVSKFDENLVITTDESLHEISTIKENVKKDILKEIKSSSIDCSIHNSGNTEIACYSFSSNNPNDYLTVPSFKKDQKDKFR